MNCSFAVILRAMRSNGEWELLPFGTAAIIALNVKLGKRGKGRTKPAQFGDARV
jgi:hypothetical protein